MSDLSLRRPAAATPEPTRSCAVVVAGIVLVAVALTALTWAKWWPYALKVGTVAAGGRVGSSILAGAGAQHADGSVWAQGLDFARTYAKAIWKALVAGLLIAAAVDAVLPRRFLLRVVGDGSRPYRSALAGALLGLPTMMCTCCAVPVAASLRRRGVGTGAAVAFWVANPMLNPAVLVFGALVLPWQLAAVRALAGVALVGFVAWLFARRTSVPPAAAAEVADETASAGAVLRRFARTLLRLAAVLVPEYAVVVLAVGVAQALVEPGRWGGSGALGALAGLVAALVGVLLVVPTSGEIPVVQWLLASGASTWVVGALLVTLPALSLPAVAMLRRTVAPRQLLALAGAAVGIGLGAGGLLTLVA